MGGDKALLRWPTATATGLEPIENGESVSLLERAALALDGFCQRVEIAVGAGDKRSSVAGEPWGTFKDATPSTWSATDGPADAGPLAGLVAALERAHSLGLAGTAVLACDMPLVERSDYEPLLERLEAGADVAMWTVEGPDGACMDQPLVAIYGPAAYLAARAAFDSGARRLVAIGDFCAAEGRHLRVDRVRAEENSSRRLVNVNTPSDYHGAVAAYLRLEPRDRGVGR